MKASTITSAKLSDGAIDEYRWRDDSITTALFSTNILTSSHVEDRAVSGSHFLSRTISRDRFANTSITASKISSFSIRDSEFKTGSFIAGKFSTDPSLLITHSKISTDAITSGILTGTFASSYFALKAFTESKFETNVITNSKLESQIVSDGKLKALGILSADFALNSITRAKLSNDDGFAFAIGKYAIQGSNLQSHVLTNSDFATGLTSSKIADHAIFSSQIGSLNLTQIADHSITARVIKLENLDSTILNNSALQTAHFLNGGIFSASLADHFIVTSNTNSAILSSYHIQELSLKEEDFKGFIPGSKINSSTLTGGEFENEFLHSSRVSTLTLTGGKIGNSEITNREIKNGTLDASNLASNTFKNSAFKAGSATVGLTSSDFALRVLTSEYIDDGSIETEKIGPSEIIDRKSTRLNSSHSSVSRMPSSA